MDLGDPLLDQDRVGTGVECGTVPVELGLTGLDLFPCGEDAMLVGVVVLGIGHRLQRGAQVGGGEGPADPGVDEFDDLVLAQVEAARVGQPVGVGVLGAVGAAVVVAAVVEAADHPAIA
ncbi:hypothetical protein LDL48_30285 [Wangella sp. NEAU-J3]|nr:hypothetical protein [Jidongwangia harbinensis]MCA2216367.1 hypothetical protein [Jidongwangia harbinensis]MCA2217102.1 hypothetical protein [Jidongwangia harbinensis]